ncbi:MAG: Crp/Fnr family transcriptional regulator [Chitinophagaceae bacterium]
MSVFKHLSNEELEQIDAQKVYQSFGKGEYLYKENSYPTGLYCISSGKIKLVNTGENGREHILEILQAGDVAGEFAIFSNSVHRSSAIALESTQVCFIPKQIFIELLHNNRMMTMDVLQTLAQNVESSQDKQKDLAQKTVKERLASTLIHFKETYGETPEHYINIKFSREEIAGFIGTSTETVIRLLSEWNNSHIITLKKKMIRINRLEELNALAGA